MKQSLPAMLIGALIAFLAQIIIAPNIVIASIMPNFLLVYIIALSIAVPEQKTLLIFAFILGLLADLSGHGPVGAMSFLFVLASFAASRVFVVLNNETTFMPVLIFVLSIFLTELLYGAFMLVFGVQAGPLEVFVYRALPCTLYDCVAALIIYPLTLKFIRSSAAGVNMPTKRGAQAGAPTTQPRLQTEFKKVRRR